MEQVVCDICGSPFPENASICPVCGYAKPENAAMLDMPGEEPAASGNYTYVKGGRFSPANVKKRNQMSDITPQELDAMDSDPQRSNWGLIAVAVVLLLLVIAAVIYMAVRFVPLLSQEDGGEEETTAAEEAVCIPCTGITLSVQSVRLEETGDGVLLNVTRQPENSTDRPVFESSDDSVAAVSGSGFITAVGPGTATISVTCGEATAECVVECTMEPVEKPSDPGQEEDPQPGENVVFTFNREDFSLFAKGETWNLYEGNVALNKVNWFSDNEKIATIQDGVVTAVGPGTTEVHAEYNGVTLTCKVHCKFERDPNEVVEVDEESLTISHTDVTIKVGETFRLRLTDKDGNEAQVAWEVSGEGIVSVDGNAVTGVKVGKVTLTVTYGDKTFSCIVRVKAS